MKLFRRLKGVGALLLLIAVFNSAGGHLVALQSIAWSAMLWSHVQRESPLAAVKNTFDGKHPCGRCHEIAGSQAKRNSIPTQELERRFNPCSLSPAAFPELSLQAAGPLRIADAMRLPGWDPFPATPPPRSSRPA